MENDKIINKIKIIDGKIIDLINQRMEQIVISKNLNTEDYFSAVINNPSEDIFRNSRILTEQEFLQRVYREIVAEGEMIKNKNLKMIAFQGEHGAYSEAAAKHWNDDLVPIPCNEFAQVFEGVESGKYDYGIVPVENTLGGIVSEVNDLMIHTKLHVTGAIEIPIIHCLVVFPGTDHREIRDVYSHPQALAQCRNFVSRNKLKPMQYYDTAGAAKMISEKNQGNSAAISSKLAAEIYNLEIIKESIEDYEINRTRFLILSKEKNTENGNKCSIVFSAAHKAGSLFSVLEKFAAESLNLTRIESIPNQLGNYAFFLDFIGSERDAKVQKVLREITEMTMNFRLIGCYDERKIK